MDDKKKKKTRIGRFLQSINFKKAAGVVGNLVTGDIKGALDIISDKDNGMTDAERDFALTVMKLDIQEMESVTQRWDSDMKSDSWLSKNVRPMSLVFLTISTMVLIYLDFYHGVELDVPGEWIELLKSLLLGVYIAYFGSRGVEKYKSISK
jgi:ABC-type Fe3+ transport system substrate-binding protein